MTGAMPSRDRLLRLALRVRFSDAVCGFKPIRADVARELVPLVRDENWFLVSPRRLMPAP